MSYSESVKTEVNGKSLWIDHQTGTYQGMAYFCCDLFSDVKKKDGGFEKKTEEKMRSEASEQLTGLLSGATRALKEGYIENFWMVVPPNVCDSVGSTKYTLPSKKGNWFVTMGGQPGDVKLVEELLIDSDFGFASLASLPEDKRKRAATDSILSAYIAVKINANHEDVLEEWEGYDEHGIEYGDAMSFASREVGSIFAVKSNFKVRGFIQSDNDVRRYFRNFRTNEEYHPHTAFAEKMSDPHRALFVEQYFNGKASKKVRDENHGWYLGDGFYRRWWKENEKLLPTEYLCWPNNFGSRGNQFCDYALSLEEVEEKRIQYKANPWAGMDNKDYG